MIKWIISHINTHTHTVTNNTHLQKVQKHTHNHINIVWKCMWMMAGLISLTWPESDRLDSGAGLGCTTVA